MFPFAFLVVCVQACLVQNAFGQCLEPAMSPVMAPGFASPRYAYAPVIGPKFPASAAFAPGAYGGEGIDDIAIVGRMPVAGTTAVAGQDPILGSVRLDGDVAAGRAVTITGNCGCERRRRRRRT